MLNSMAQHAQSHADVAERTFKTLHARYRDPKKVWGYSWGFQRLDELTGGIQWEGTKELTVVGARSNVGKSAFGMRVALEVSQQFKREFPGLEVRIILLEMTPDACYQRLIGQIAGVNLTRLRSGFMDAHEWQQVERAKVALDGLPITYLSGSYHVDSIKQFVSGDVGTGRACGYWLLDHIGIVPTEAARQGGNQSFSLGEISRGLLTVARRHAPGMVLAQLNRESTKRKDPTPNAADIYGSDRILQDTDVLLLLDRPELRVRRAPDEQLEQEIGYVIIEKQREGPTNQKIPVMFTPSRVLWSDLPEEILRELEETK